MYLVFLIQMCIKPVLQMTLIAMINLNNVYMAQIVLLRVGVRAGGRDEGQEGWVVGRIVDWIK